MLQGERSAILSTFIKLPAVIKIFILSFFEWPFYTGFYCIIQSFSVSLKDDNIPELEEIFEIRLVAVRSDDNETGSTDVSGASIDPDNSKSRVVMPENDYPYGLLQFSESDTPPLPNDPYIPPATLSPTVSHLLSLALFLLAANFHVC